MSKSKSKFVYYLNDFFSHRLAELVVSFQEKVDDLIIVDEEIDLEVRSLETCAYSTQIFKETLSKIQKSVDDLSLRQYSNLHAWVGKLDEAVEEKLGLRLQVKNFVQPFVLLFTLGLFGLNPILDPQFGLSRVGLAYRVETRVQSGRVGLK